MRIFDATQEQIDHICEYLKKKYPPKRDCDVYDYGINCACSHCPYGYSNDGYDKVWDCLAYLADSSDLSQELEEVANGNGIQ